MSRPRKYRINKVLALSVLSLTLLLIGSTAYFIAAEPVDNHTTTTTLTKTLTLATSTSTIVTNDSSVLAIQNCVYAFQHINGNLWLYFVNGTQISNQGPDPANHDYAIVVYSCPSGYNSTSTNVP